jgi:creatinine amidohydrolase/Fe(II)-dependent formamide hydrolase-like protein
MTTTRSTQSRRAALAIALLTASAAAAAQVATVPADDREQRIREMLAMPNPIAPLDSPWMNKLTWIEVRDRIRAGDTTVIVPTGGLEENGPYLATGKHNVILEAMCPAIARELGNALCAPIVPFVPEGNIKPPSGHMHFPGTIGVSEQTFRSLLSDIAASLRQNGFTDIVLIGDSGGNQEGMAAVAADLNGRWQGDGARVHFVSEFYTSGWDLTMEYADRELGVRETRSDGFHDDIWVTAMMMVIDPETVRFEQRLAEGLASINGVELTPLDEMVEIGRKMVDYRARHTAGAIREAIAAD